MGLGARSSFDVVIVGRGCSVCCASLGAQQNSVTRSIPGTTVPMPPLHPNLLAVILGERRGWFGSGSEVSCECGNRHSGPDLQTKLLSLGWKRGRHGLVASVASVASEGRC